MLEGRDHMADQGVCGMIVLNPYKFSVWVCGHVSFGSGWGLFEHDDDLGRCNQPSAQEHPVPWSCFACVCAFFFCGPTLCQDSSVETKVANHFFFQPVHCAVRHGLCLTPPCQCQSIPPPLHVHYTPGGPWSSSPPFVFLPQSSGECFPANGHAAPMGEPMPHHSLAFFSCFAVAEEDVWNVEWAYSVPSFFLNQN